MPQDLIRRVLMRLDKNYLPYEYFDQLKNFETIEIFDGAFMTRLPTIRGLYFHSNMNAGTEIIEHYHNAKEFFHLTKGKILINDTVTLEAGDSFSFKPFELHNIKVLEECEMYIQFLKDAGIKAVN